MLAQTVQAGGRRRSLGPRARRLWRGAGARASLALLASAALASPASAAELELRGPESCSDREQLVFHVSRLLKEPLEQVPQLAFVAEVSAARAGYVARLSVVDSEQPGRTSERRLQESSCARLMEALGVVIVLTIQGGRDPAAAEEAASTAAWAVAAQPPASLETGETSGAERVDLGADATAAAAEDGAPLEPGVALWLLADSSALPEPALGVGLSLELTRGRLRLAAAGALFPDQRVRLEGRGNPAPGADLGLALGSLAACYDPLGGWDAELALGACVRGELGRLYGQGTNLSAPRSEARWWIAPGLDLLGAWRAHPALRLSAQLGATVPLSRPAFRLGELGELYRPSPLSFRAGIGVGIVFE